MKQLWTIFMTGLVILVLAACSPDTGTSNDMADVAAVADSAAPRLSDEYEDALSIQGQLALGTVQLEGSDLAVNEVQAAELLPLWQALQSLSNSDTAAEIEIEAVVDQIQDTMSTEQIQAIAEMALISDSLTELIESGELQPGFGRGFGDDGGERGFPAGGFGGGFPGGFGGGPGGGGQGGGFTGGGFAGGGNLNEDDIATRQAARESGALGEFQERVLVGMAVRLLADKTGEEIVNPRGNIVGTVLAAVGEATDLSVEEIQAQLTDGQSLAEVVEANDGNVTAVREAIIKALKALPNTDTLDAEQIADDWLGGQP